jgi:hypothetical protein
VNVAGVPAILEAILGKTFIRLSPKGDGLRYCALDVGIRQVAYNLRGGFLVRPLIVTLTLGCAGALLSFPRRAGPLVFRFGSDGVSVYSDPQVAQVIQGGHRDLHHHRGLDRFRDPADDAHPGLHAVFPAHHRSRASEMVQQWANFKSKPRSSGDLWVQGLDGQIRERWQPIAR